MKILVLALCCLCYADEFVEDLNNAGILKNPDTTLAQKLILTAERFATTQNIPLEKILLVVGDSLSSGGNSFRTDMNLLVETRPVKLSSLLYTYAPRADFIAALQFPYFVIIVTQRGYDFRFEEDPFIHVRRTTILTIVYGDRGTIPSCQTSIYISPTKGVFWNCVANFEDILAIEESRQKHIFQRPTCGRIDSCLLTNIEIGRDRAKDPTHMKPNFNLTYRCNQTYVSALWEVEMLDTRTVVTPYERHILMYESIAWDDPVLVLTMMKRREPYVSDLFKAFQPHVWLCFILSNLAIAVLIAFAERRKPFPLVYEKIINFVNQVSPMTAPRNNCGYLLAAMGLLLNYLMAVAFSNDFTSFFLTTYKKPVASKLCGSKYVDDMDLPVLFLNLLRGEAVYGLSESDIPKEFSVPIFQTHRNMDDFKLSFLRVKIGFNVLNAYVILPSPLITTPGVMSLQLSPARRSVTLERNREHGLFTAQLFKKKYRKIFNHNIMERALIKLGWSDVAKFYKRLSAKRALCDESGTTFSLSNLLPIFVSVCKLALLPVLVFILELCMQSLNNLRLLLQLSLPRRGNFVELQ